MFAYSTYYVHTPHKYTEMTTPTKTISFHTTCEKYAACSLFYGSISAMDEFIAALRWNLYIEKYKNI